MCTHNTDLKILLPLNKYIDYRYISTYQLYLLIIRSYKILMYLCIYAQWYYTYE